MTTAARKSRARMESYTRGVLTKTVSAAFRLAGFASESCGNNPKYSDEGRHAWHIGALTRVPRTREEIRYRRLDGLPLTDRDLATARAIVRQAKEGGGGGATVRWQAVTFGPMSRGEDARSGIFVDGKDVGCIEPLREVELGRGSSRKLVTRIGGYDVFLFGKRLGEIYATIAEARGAVREFFKKQT